MTANCVDHQQRLRSLLSCRGNTTMAHLIWCTRRYCATYCESLVPGATVGLFDIAPGGMSTIQRAMMRGVDSLVSVPVTSGVAAYDVTYLYGGV
jgi:hypothetical protein